MQARRWVGLVLLSIVASRALAAEPIRLRVRMAESVADRPITGRLFVFTTRRAEIPPIQALNWFGPEPFFAVEVKEFVPGETRVLDDTADGFPGRLSTIPAGEYRVQAILDHDFYYPNPASGPGNLFSETVTANLDPTVGGDILLELAQRVPERPQEDKRHVKFLSPRSELLSNFHHRDVLDHAAVVLPASYDEHPERRYPVYVEVSGFGGSLEGMTGRYRDGPPVAKEGEAEFIRVMLTGECKWGHHVYANSATNGPRGDALVHELIPLIDSRFRTIADPRARFVGGHSSGGWSSLWLQVNYPDAFGGVWSTSPDPVDFRDWQTTDLYASPPQSVFTTPSGQRRGIARRGPNTLLYYDSFSRMDDVMGRGGQLRSFEAVFSTLDARGEPRRCWDRATGLVDPSVVEEWRRYDIGLLLDKRWPELSEKLANKIRIAMGEFDTFYLEGATMKLAERLKQLGSDARIEIVPGAGHGLPAELHARHAAERSEIHLRRFDIEGRLRQ